MTTTREDSIRLTLQQMPRFADIEVNGRLVWRHDEDAFCIDDEFYMPLSLEQAVGILCGNLKWWLAGPHISAERIGDHADKKSGL